MGAKVKTRNGTNFVLSLTAVSCLSQDRVDLTDLIILGPKPQMPGNWDGTPILRGLPGPAAIPDAAPVANVKRGKYHKLEPELKYQFFETHRLLKNKSIRETMAWFNEHLPLVYCTEGNLTLNIVEKWRTKYSERPVPPPVEKAEEKIKPGPKKRALKFG